MDLNEPLLPEPAQTGKPAPAATKRWWWKMWLMMLAFCGDMRCLPLIRLGDSEKALLDLLTDLKDADAAEASSENSSSSEVGHSCVVMGPAGSGKTTLVNVLGGVAFPTGPQVSDRTLKAHSCHLKLQGVMGKVVLIDTPGCSPDTGVDIESEYQKFLKEEKLVSEYVPNIVQFCISASNIRQFQHEDAKKMGDQLIWPKFDQRVCIKVLPIVTFADTQAEEDLKKVMPEIKKLVETVFEQTCSTVEEPVFTMFPANGEARGVEEVKDRLRKILLEQEHSEGLSDQSSNSGSEASSFTIVSHPTGSPRSPAPLENEILALLAQMTKHAEKGFQDVRVPETFVKDVTKGPSQLILNHSCLVLGPAGAGKTTLMNHLGGSRYKTGPLECHRTLEFQICDLKLDNITDKLRVMLIDTPGLSPGQKTNLDAGYQQVLKKENLVSEHAPYNVLFCVSASSIRQFQHEDAKKMGQQLQNLKFDKSFKINVLPVVTFADTQSEKELKEILPEIQKHVETAFENIGVTVLDPVATRIPPDREAQGVEEVKDRLREMLLDQLQSDHFSHLWRSAFAKSMVSATKEHSQKFPENDSSFRLFKRAFCTVAAVCGKEVSDLEAFDEITAPLVKSDQVEDLPWWTISLIPGKKETETCLLPSFSCRASFFPKWPASLLIMVIVLLFSALHTWDMARLDQMSHGLEEAKANETRVKNEIKTLRGKYGGLKSKYIEALEEQKEALEEQKEQKEKNDHLQSEVDKYSCSWTHQPGQCMGLSQLDRVWKAKDCREVCCRMGREICSTWQFDDRSSECWLGTPTDCSDGDDGWAGGRLSSA